MWLMDPIYRLLGMLLFRLILCQILASSLDDDGAWRLTWQHAHELNTYQMSSVVLSTELTKKPLSKHTTPLH